jgi:hypothetical protein
MLQRIKVENVLNRLAQSARINIAEITAPTQRLSAALAITECAREYGGTAVPRVSSDVNVVSVNVVSLANAPRHRDIKNPRCSPGLNGGIGGSCTRLRLSFISARQLLCAGPGSFCPATSRGPT